jgi:hypothetical protein
MFEFKSGDFEMSNVVLELCDNGPFIKIGRPEFGHDRFNELFCILGEQIRFVYAVRRQGILRGDLPESHILHHIIIEKFLNKLVKKKNKFIQRNGCNGHNHVVEKFVLRSQFGNKYIPWFFAENFNNRGFSCKINDAFYVHIVLLGMDMWIEYCVKDIL